jgi:hypothetical protein
MYSVHPRTAATTIYSGLKIARVQWILYSIPQSVYSYSYVSDDIFLFYFYFFVFDIIAESACHIGMIRVSFFHKIVDRP